MTDDAMPSGNKGLHLAWFAAMFRAPVPYPRPPGAPELPSPCAPEISPAMLARWFAETHLLAQNVTAPLPPGPAGIRLAIERLGRGLDEWVITADAQLEDGDLVLTRFTARARHAGKLGVISATGARLLFQGMLMTRIAGGKAIESWLEVDLWSALSEIDAIVRSADRPRTPHVERAS
jgi:hypothetical protein